MNPKISLKRPASDTDFSLSEQPAPKKSKLNPIEPDVGHFIQQGENNKGYTTTNALPFPLCSLSERRAAVIADASTEYTPNALLKKAIFDYIQAAKASDKEGLKQSIENLIRNDYAAFVPCENVPCKLLLPYNTALIQIFKQAYSEQKRHIDQQSSLSLSEGQYEAIEKTIKSLNEAIVYQSYDPSETVLHSLFRAFSFRNIIHSTIELSNYTEAFLYLQGKALSIEKLEYLKQKALETIRTPGFENILDKYLKSQSESMQLKVTDLEIFTQNLNATSHINKQLCVQAIQAYFQSFTQTFEDGTALHACALAMIHTVVNNFEKFLPTAWDPMALGLDKKIFSSHQQNVIDWDSLKLCQEIHQRTPFKDELLSFFQSNINAFYEKRQNGFSYLSKLIQLLQTQEDSYSKALEAQLQGIEDILEIVFKLSEEFSDATAGLHIELNAENKQGQTALDILASSLDTFIKYLNATKIRTLSEAQQTKVKNYFIRFVSLLNVMTKGGAFSENFQTVFTQQKRLEFLNLLGCIPNLSNYDELFGFIYNHSFVPNTIKDEEESDMYTTDISYLDKEIENADASATETSDPTREQTASQPEKELYVYFKKEDPEAAYNLLNNKEIFPEHRQLLLSFLSGKHNIAQYDRFLSYVYYYIAYVTKGMAVENSSDEEQ